MPFADILNILPVELRPWAILGFITLGGVFFWLKWTDTIPQGSLGIRTSAGAIKLRYDKKEYSRAEIARQKAVDGPLIKKGQPAKYGRPKVWQPGLHLQVMVYHKYDKIIAQNQPFDVDDIMVTTDDGYRGVLFPQVKVHICAKDDKSVYLMRTATHDLPAALKAIVNTELSQIMRLRGHDAAIEMSPAYQEEIAKALKKATKARFEQLGIKFVGLDLGTAVEVTQLATGRSVSTMGESITMSKLVAAVSEQA